MPRSSSLSKASLNMLAEELAYRAYLKVLHTYPSGHFRLAPPPYEDEDEAEVERFWQEAITRAECAITQELARLEHEFRAVMDKEKVDETVG